MPGRARLEQPLYTLALIIDQPRLTLLEEKPCRSMDALLMSESKMQNLSSQYENESRKKKFSTPAAAVSIRLYLQLPITPFEKFLLHQSQGTAHQWPTAVFSFKAGSVGSTDGRLRDLEVLRTLVVR